MSLTAAQLEERRAYLGGTDAAALAGVNPPGWSQPIDVYLDKHGLAPERRASTAMDVGSALEQLVAELATAATGMRWRRREKPVRHPEYPWMGGHLDRVAAGYDLTLLGREGQHFEQGLERALLECKTATSRKGWGEQGTTTVPLHYAVQVQHYLAVTGRPVAVLAVLLGYGDFRWYRLERDEAMIAMLVDLEAEWWRRHGPPNGVPPEPDGSESYGAHLRRLHSEDDGSEAVATPEQLAMLDEYRAANDELVAATVRREAAAQRLQRSMGSHTKLLAAGATVTWRQNKPTLRVQWEALALELVRQVRAHSTPEWAPPATKKAQAELVRQVARDLDLATEEPGARPFRVEFSDEQEA